MKLSLVVIVANAGRADEIMDVIKLDGARGGTIINGNSSVSANALKLYGISIQKEKDCILVIVDSSIKNKIFHPFLWNNLWKLFLANAFKKDWKRFS